MLKNFTITIVCSRCCLPFRSQSAIHFDLCRFKQVTAISLDSMVSARIECLNLDCTCSD
jgi:hypothetical protein